MGSYGEAVAAVVVCSLLAVFFVVCAVQLRRGKWIRFLSGNTFLTPEELADPRRVANARAIGTYAMPAGAAMCLGIAVLALGDVLGVWALLAVGGVLAGVGTVSMCAAIAWIEVRSYRAMKRGEKKLDLTVPPGVLALAVGVQLLVAAAVVALVRALG